MKDLITIIVPIYNTSLVLKKCLDSIVNQSYTNLEIILIDDGSTDYSLDICYSYANKDKRIIVLSKENGGQASARNLGLDIAKGVYISFVDSDDYVANDFIQILYDNIIKFRADISVINNNRLTKNYKDETVSIKSNTDIIAAFLNSELLSVVWDKLYHIKLFHGLRFNENTYFEDNDLIYKIFAKTNILVKSSHIKYFYCVENSQTMSTINGIKKGRAIDNILKIYQRQNIFFEKKYPNLLNNFYISASCNIFDVYYKYLDSNILFKEAINYKKKISYKNISIKQLLKLQFYSFPSITRQIFKYKK